MSSYKSPKQSTDKERGIVTIKIGEEVRNIIRAMKGKYNFEKYDDLLNDMIYVFENYVNIALERYIQDLNNKCPNCQNRGTDKCNSNLCDTKFLFDKLEECQEWYIF